MALISDKVRHGLMARFRSAVEKSNFDVDDVRAGREYVDAYVPYVHYVESVWEAASREEGAHHAGHAAKGSGASCGGHH